MAPNPEGRGNLCVLCVGRPGGVKFTVEVEPEPGGEPQLD